jgi:error-prone DNA polymerase
VGFDSNPSMPWPAFEDALSGHTTSAASPPESPPSSVRRRDGYSPPEDLADRQITVDGAPELRVPYAELHAHSSFSFLDGASDPEELVEQAARLGLDAVAITDHDGMYGVVRAAAAAKALGVHTVFGS